MLELTGGMIVIGRSLTVANWDQALRCELVVT
jgi:hypothetical protein